MTLTNAGTFAVQAGVPALGQALAASSLPVVLTAAQLTTLTPPTTVAVTQSTSPWVVGQATASSLKAQAMLLDSAGTNVGTVKAASTQSVAADTSLIIQLNPNQPNLTTALNVHDATPASTPVTNIGTFAVQAAQSGTWNVGTLTSITNSVAVTGTFWQATQPVSLTSTTITGTVAVTQSGTWTVATNADGSASGGTAATKPTIPKG